MRRMRGRPGAAGGACAVRRLPVGGGGGGCLRREVVGMAAAGALRRASAVVILLSPLRAALGLPGKGRAPGHFCWHSGAAPPPPGSPGGRVRVGGGCISRVWWPWGGAFALGRARSGQQEVRPRPPLHRRPGRERPGRVPGAGGRGP